MYQLAEKYLKVFSGIKDKSIFSKSLIGLEKETLRVSHEGGLAQTAHPLALGSALTHPYITTDYSEALLEIVTPPSQDIPSVLNFLNHTQNFIYNQLDDGSLIVELTGRQGSGILSSMSEANCLIVLNDDQSGINKGDNVLIELLN